MLAQRSAPPRKDLSLLLELSFLPLLLASLNCPGAPVAPTAQLPTLAHKAL